MPINDNFNMFIMLITDEELNGELISFLLILLLIESIITESLFSTFKKYLAISVQAKSARIFTKINSNDIG